MTALVPHRTPYNGSQAIALPEPRGGAINIRLAMVDDLPFIDALQKKHSTMVGFFPRPWFENNIASGHVLIAEEVSEPRPSGSGGESVGAGQAGPLPYGRGSVHRAPVGYCIYKDRYLKREELGIVYQLNVTPGKQRGLVGAALVKAAFERCPYGVKLFCCWCAQDIQANYFWESIGFVPIAFRTGSRKAGQKKEPRIHIFWQRRIREGDAETPYWFPSETSGGAVRENRLVLPIPPGTHWSDAKPAILPGMEKAFSGGGEKQLPGHSRAGGNAEGAAPGDSRGRRKQKQPKPNPTRPAHVHPGGLWFAPPAPPQLPPLTAEEKKAEASKRKAEKSAAPRFKNDPKLVAAARELRDRYTEQINAAPHLLLPPSACGKYDVSRQLEAAPSVMKVEQVPGVNLLEAA